MIKGILFDFDGTLAETNTLIVHCMQKTFLELFGAYTDDDVMACIGPPLIIKGQEIFPDDPQRFVDTYRKYQFESHDEMIAVYPGVMEMLEKLHTMDIKLGIVTSKKRDMFFKGLRKLGMEKYFDVFVTEDDVTAYKPDPQPIQQGLKLLGIKPEEALMVGDNSHDIGAAKAASVQSVLVGWTIKGVDEMRKYEPDFIIDEADQLFAIIENFNEQRSN